MEHTINTADAIRWLAFATKLDARQIVDRGLNDDDLKFFGHHLSRNKLLNPPRDIPTKIIAAICITCHQGFIDEYRTKKPIHCYNCRR